MNGPNMQCYVIFICCLIFLSVDALVVTEVCIVLKTLPQLKIKYNPCCFRYERQIFLTSQSRHGKCPVILMKGKTH